MLITAIAHHLRAPEYPWGERVYAVLGVPPLAGMSPDDTPALFVALAGETATLPNRLDHTTVGEITIRRQIDIVAALKRQTNLDRVGQMVADNAEIVRSIILGALLDWAPADCIAPLVYESMAVLTDDNPIAAVQMRFSAQEVWDADRMRENVYPCGDDDAAREVVVNVGGMTARWRPGMPDEDCEV